MMQAILNRIEKTPQGTIGILHTDKGFLCWAMELPWHLNQQNVSCIPDGVYQALPHRSPRFGRTYIMANTPGRSFILIHSGNVGGDRHLGWQSHTRGCIILGRRRGRLTLNGLRQKAVLVSKSCIREFLDSAGGDPMELTITGGY